MITVYCTIFGQLFLWEFMPLSKGPFSSREDFKKRGQPLLLFLLLIALSFR